MNSRSGVLTRVRGGAVGSLSGGVGIAAHGIGGGTPTQGAVVLLLVASAALGAVVGTVHVHRRLAFTLFALAAGQVLGHATLSMLGGHIHSLVPSTPMLAAHVTALVITAALVLATETACLRALSVLVQVVLTAITPPPVATPLWSATPVYRSKVSLWLLIGATAGTRGPPLYI